MKIAVIGGTGKIGGAVAKHLAKSNSVIIGSRDPVKAEGAAKKIDGAVGADYATAAREAEAAVVAVPYSALATLSVLADKLSGKLVISTVNPLKFENGLTLFALERGSAAEELAELLPKSRVATGFNNVPPLLLQRDEVVPMDVMVAADTRETYDEAAKIIGSIPNIRPLYAGPLSQAGLIEALTAVVLNLASLNKTGSLTTRFASRRE